MNQTRERAIELTPAQQNIIENLLQRRLPETEIWAYGSRVKGTAKPWSDLDLVVFANSDQRNAVAELREAFEESDLPFRVDLFIWNDIPESFRENIEKEHVVLQKKAEVPREKAR